MKKKSAWLKPVEALTTPFFHCFLIKQNPVVNPAKIHKKTSFFQLFFHSAEKFHTMSYDPILFTNLLNNVWKVFSDNIGHVEK